MTLRITSLQNPKVKAAVRLRERKGREEAGLMLVEGYAELSLACRAGLTPVELFFCPELARPGELPLLEALRGAGTAVVEVTPAVMEKLAYRQHPGAWLAVAALPRRGLADLDLPPAPLLVVAEAVEKPGNLGAILRSADAAGVDALIVCDRRTDLWNPNVVRASKGTVFQVPVAEADSGEALAWLRARGIRIAAATPAATASMWEADLCGAVAIAVGAEKEGLSPVWLEAADLRVAIPMRGRADSLNVAQAATLLVYEALRQRRERG
jgi:TrmH family RNA methyltransferase